MDDESEQQQMAAALALSLETPTAAHADDEEERQVQAALALSMQHTGGGDEAAELEAALALSLQPPQPAAPAHPMDVDLVDEPEPEPTAEALGELVFGTEASPAALRQWHSQGICLGSVEHEMSRAPASDDTASVPFGAGILQEQGGPCAVLAAAQGFLLRRLLFDPDVARPQPEPAWRAEAGPDPLLPSAERALDALLSGLADMLWTAATAGLGAAGAAGDGRGCFVALLPAEQLPFSGDAAALRTALLRVGTRTSSWAATRDALRARLPALEAEQGALSFLYSAVLSRGLARFGRERDDNSEPLLHPTFGHCAQEVLNLLLAGRGVSNVFDGERDLGGMVMRGVRERPAIGILSELEALRYVEVGSLFKQPHHPLWVIASESHYSLLFALSGAVQDTSALASLEEQLLRAFSAYDTEGNGFVPADDAKLGSLLSSLPDFRTPPLAELRASLDPESISLVTWEKFLAVMLPLHPEAAALRTAADAATAAPGTFELLHYNGLAGRGHSGKGLRALTVEPGAARGQPMATQGLTACVQTRWKDALVVFDGPPPSIN